jgi:hypothetical protein
MQTCTKCNVEKQLSEFKQLKTTVDSMCIACRTAFPCHYCEKAYASELSRNNHIRIYHDPSMVRLNCAVEGCDFVCSNRKELNAHRKKEHVDKQSYPCPYCGKVYKRNTNRGLKRHIANAHEKKEKYKCDQCDYVSNSKDNYKVHMVTHSDERPYACDYEDCNSTFKLAGKLSRHIKEIHKSNGVQCPHCDEMRSTQDNLVRHIRRIHNNELRYTCSICDDYKFFDASDCKRHEEVCTGEFSGSNGEYQVAQALEKYATRFRREVCVCTNASGRYLRMDFELPFKPKKAYIEYQGRQHFSPQRFTSSVTEEEAEAKFAVQQEHDAIKKDWCEKNGHPLLCIPYTALDNIDELIEDFIMEHDES